MVAGIVTSISKTSPACSFSRTSAPLAASPDGDRASCPVCASAAPHYGVVIGHHILIVFTG
jgi:hypothetical protein